MSLKYGMIVANVSESTQDFWDHFKRTCRGNSLKYRTALEQAAALWLNREGAPHTGTAGPSGPFRANPFTGPGPLPFTDPAPVPYDPED